MRSHVSRRVHLACAGVAVGIVPVLFADQARGADRSWIDPAGGAFFTAGNWSPAVVPGAADVAHFNLSSAYTVSVSGANPTNLRLRQGLGTVTLDLNTRTYALTSPGLPIDPSIAVGIGGSPLPRRATLIVTDGTLSGVSALLGSGAVRPTELPDEGRISVTTAGRLNVANLFAGFENPGLLSVADGGDGSFTGATLGYGSLARGGMTVSGAGSTVNTTFVNVGLAGDGTASVSGGGVVTTTLETHVGRFAGSTGVVSVAGAGSSWTNSGTLMSIGGIGTGTLTVSDGGLVSSPTPVLGDGTGSSGAATVTGAGSRWTATGGVSRIGNFGAGALTISNAGTAAFGGSASLADRPGSSGAVSVTGAGSLWRTFQVIVGDGGTGSMSITAGGVVDNFGLGAIVGNDGSGRGSVLIDGVGSQWEIGNAAPDGGLGLSVGASGLGSVTISNGAAVHAPAVKIAGELNSPGSGTVLVTGANSLLRSTGSILMAHHVATAARLTIDAGATVEGESLTIGGPATVIVTGGSLVTGALTNDGTFTQTGGVTTAGPVAGTSTISLAGAASFTADHVRVPTLVVGGNSAVRVRPNGTDAGTSAVKNLVIGGSPGAWQGTLDLADNDLIIDYDAVSPLLNVADQIRTAYNGGAWNGAGGITSGDADATNFALGYSESSAVFTTFPATFSGQSVDDTAVLVKFTRYGDANLDGTVNLQDFNTLAANFGQTNRFWRQGDFNYDGTVNLQDFNRLAANFGMSAAGPDVTPDDWAALAAAVPEPALVAPLATLALGLGRARRRRQLRLV